MLKGGKFYTKLGLPESAVLTSGVLADILYRTDYDWTEVFTASGWKPVADYLVGDITVEDATVTVESLQNQSINDISPVEGQYLYHDGTQWIPSGIQTNLIQERTVDTGIYFPNVIGIGAAPTTGAHQLLVQDDTVDTTIDYDGIHASFTKIAGASDYSDNFAAVWGEIFLDQSGGEIGTLYGARFDATVTDGSIGAVGNVKNVYGVRGAVNVLTDGVITGSEYGVVFVSYVQGGTVSGAVTGLYGQANLDTGTVSGNVYGMQANVDIESGMTAVGGDVYGAYIQVDDDFGASGTVYGLRLRLLSGVDYAIYAGDGQPSYHSGIFDIAGGVRTAYSENNVTDPPTDGECDTAFGAIATLGDGFMGILNDAGAETDVWLCVTAGGSWFTIQLI